MSRTRGNIGVGASLGFPGFAARATSEASLTIDPRSGTFLSRLIPPLGIAEHLGSSLPGHEVDTE